MNELVLCAGYDQYDELVQSECTVLHRPAAELSAPRLQRLQKACTNEVGAVYAMVYASRP